MVRFLLVVLALSFASRGQAQELPAWLKVRASQLAYQEAQPAAQPEAKQRRGGYMAAAGAGMLLGSAAYLGAFATRGAWCYEDQRVAGALPVGLILAGAGAALAVAGALRLHKSRRALPFDPYQRVLMGWTAIGVAAATFAVPMVANPDTWACLSS